MAATKQDLIIEKGATFEMNLVYREEGVYVDLTALRVKMTIREKQDMSSPEILSIDSAESGSPYIALGLQGQIDITVPPSVTKAIGQSFGFYDLVLEQGVDDTDRLLEGFVKFKPGVTDLG